MNMVIIRNIALVTAILFSFAVAAQKGEQQDKIVPRIDLSYFRSNDDASFILVNVRKKEERRFLPMSGVPFHASLIHESNEYDLGTATTNIKGEGKIFLTGELIMLWDSITEVEFLVSVAPSDSTEEASESVAFKHARIRISSEEAEDAKKITAIIEQKDDAGWRAVPDTEVKFFIERFFGKLPIGDESYSADENGIAEIEFVEKIPGDSSGNIRLGCMIDDHEEFGNISATTQVKWGAPFSDDNKEFQKRTLWSTRDKTPYWLLIFPNVIIAGVWGIIGYLLLQIIRIKRLAESNT